VSGMVALARAQAVSSGIAQQCALRNRMEEAFVPDFVLPRFQNYQFTVTEPTPLEGTVP